MYKDDEFMNIAYKEALLAYKKAEVPIGAALVNENRMIAKAHNTCKKQNNFLKHAEIIAIEKAIKILKTPYLETCSIYVTLEPCEMCMAAIKLTRINKIYFGSYRNSLTNIIESNDMEIYGGIKEQECSKLIKNFFKNIRN